MPLLPLIEPHLLGYLPHPNSKALGYLPYAHAQVGLHPHHYMQVLGHHLLAAYLQPLIRIALGGSERVLEPPLQLSQVRYYPVAEIAQFGSGELASEAPLAGTLPRDLARIVLVYMLGARGLARIVLVYMQGA